MSQTLIKFCGMRRREDVAAALALGVHLLGFIFAPGSARRIELERARALRDEIGSRAQVVALFRNNDARQINAVVTELSPDLLQFHGDEDQAFCAGFGLPWIKAVPMNGLPGAKALADFLAAHSDASRLLFDSHGGNSDGGSGRRFDWSRIQPELAARSMLAGGLNAENVAAAISALRPWAVDVASGIESAPGIKDSARMRAFVEAVNRADQVNVRHAPVG